MNRNQRRRLKATGEPHEVFRQELLALVKRHVDVHDLPSEDVLAITANVVGMCLAMQNQNTMTKDQAWHIIASNIEQGNKTVVDGLQNSPGGNA